MSYDAARFECKVCGAKFLKELALRGHKSVHADDTVQEVINGP